MALFALGGGGSVRLLLPESEGAQRRESILLHIEDRLDELQSEGYVKWADVERERLLDESLDDLERRYVELTEEESGRKDLLGHLISENYARDELELIVPINPKTAEYFLFLGTNYDGKRMLIPIDGGEWDGFFRSSRFGLGAEAAFKSYLLESIEVSNPDAVCH